MTSDANLLYTEVEEELRASVRAALARKLSAASVIALYDSGVVDSDLWTTLAGELGLAGLLAPEEYGGAGATTREAAVVVEELGRSVVPVPFLTSAVIAMTTVLAAQAHDLVGRVASGTVAALAVPFATGPSTSRATVTADSGGVLHGQIRSVAGADWAEVLLVPAESPDGFQIYSVPADQARIKLVVSLDMSRPVADIDVTGATGEPIAGGDAARAAVARALETGAALLASEQVGLAHWCLDSTLEYLKVRKQFGRVVGGFQALKHRLADLFTQVESARAAARYAAATAAAGDADSAIAASIAQAYCSDIAVLAAEECVQLHGGIGMTWEHPAHLYLKRAKADQIALGTPEKHHARLAELIDLPAT
ncbi:acyl-CoA dehydrogenase family protein [Nocardia sp. NPDC056611]|uniref:acyl-CoA dehydrogenase family protein n=1 Tax=Nocardia sp. NPDC056611 TaxID=3345877 RepID=UPI00366FA533